MIPGVAVIVWGYVIARLLQVPTEFQGPEKGPRMWWLSVTSVIGIVVCTVGLILVLSAGISNPSSQP